MKKFYFLLCCFLTLIRSVAQVCNPAGNVMLYTNYDGGTLTINVNQNIPNLKIGVCSYEACLISLTGAFVANVTEVRYAGYNSSNNSNCGSPAIPTTTIVGAPVGATTSITFAPPSTLSNTNGYSSIICGYSCNNNTSQGGCNTVDQIEAYFMGVFSGNTLFAHRVQYGCWTGTQSVSIGGTCCPPPPVYAGSIAGSQTICAGALPNFLGSVASASAASGTILYQWQASTTSSLAGFTNIAGANTATFTTPGLNTTTYYRRAASTTTANVAYSNVLTLSVAPLPTLSINGPTAVCIGQAATLTASGGASYSWSASNSGGTSVVIIPTVGIVVSTTCWPANSNCSVTSNWSLAVNPLPVVFAGNSPTVLCTGKSATFTATGALSYNWQPGNLTGSTQTLIGTTSTVYTVTGTDANGCSNSTYLAIQTNPPPAVLTIGSNTLCSGQTLTLGVTGALNYTWQPGAWIGSTIAVSPGSSVVYSISATDGDGCEGYGTHSMTVLPAPTIAVSADRNTICSGEKTTLSASGANTFLWPASITQTAANTATVAPTSTSAYTITGSDSNGCTGKSVITVTVSACLDAAEESRFQKTLSVYPNPGSGDINIVAEELLDLNLYNSSGQLVKHIHLNEKNNFRVQLRNLAEGVYYISTNNTNTPLKKILIVKQSVN